MKIIGHDTDTINFLFRDGLDFYRGSITSTNFFSQDYLLNAPDYINVSYAFNIHIPSDIDEDGVPPITGIIPIGANVLTHHMQGIGLYNNRLYVPLTEKNGEYSIILMYDTVDISTASGTLQPLLGDDNRVWFYCNPARYTFFEIESCGVNPNNNQLYFSCNRNGTNKDAVCYVSGYTAP